MMNLKKLHNNWRKGILLSACFVFTLSILPGCKKTPSKFGTEALDINELLASGGKDTFQLKTYSILFDTLSTDNQLLGNLGTCHDPKFGIVNASIYTQMSINGKVSLPQGSVFGNVDSVVLSLNYDGGYYGKLDPQTFEVYQLADTLHKNSVYRRNTTKAIMGSNLVDPGSATQTPKPSTKVVIDSDGDGDMDTVNPQLRLKLDNGIGQQFINDIIAGNAAFESNEAFLNSGYFKGFKINVANAAPGVGKGAVLYFRLGNSQTKMTIYYKLANDPAVQRRVELFINASCGDFNHVDIDNSGYHIADVLANPLNGQTQFYSQSFNAIPKIEFPTLNNLSSKTVINNALLYLPVAYQTGNEYYPTQTFRVAYRDEAGGFVLLGYNGSVLSATYEDNQKAFVFDLRHYLQELVNLKKQNTGIYLFPSLTYFNCTADRVVFNGPASPYKSRPKLVIKYTEFK